MEVVGRRVDISTYVGWAGGVVGYNVLRVVNVARTKEVEGWMLALIVVLPRVSWRIGVEGPALYHYGS